jgi:ABC-type antimicrobial peptide transport system permease subunit
MVQSLQERTSGIRSVGNLMAGLGAIALVLAAVGIYSLMAYVVSQRRHEIGLRMALGATRGGVVRLMFGQTGRLAVIGLGIGLVATVLVGTAAERALVGLVALEPALVFFVTLVLVTVALLATVIPAQHAARIDPATALRLE